MYRTFILNIVHLDMYMIKTTECIQVISVFIQKIDPLETGEKEYYKILDTLIINATGRTKPHSYEWNRILLLSLFHNKDTREKQLASERWKLQLLAGIYFRRRSIPNIKYPHIRYPHSYCSES